MNIYLAKIFDFLSKYRIYKINYNKNYLYWLKLNIEIKIN